MTNDYVVGKTLAIYKDWFNLNISSPDREHQLTSLIQSFRNSIRNATIDECKEKIRDERLRYNNSKLPLRYEECIVLLDQLKTQEVTNG